MATKLITTREERGQAIAQLNGQVKRLDDCTYTVKSQSHNGEYTVSKSRRMNGFADAPITLTDI